MYYSIPFRHSNDLRFHYCLLKIVLNKVLYNIRGKNKFKHCSWLQGEENLVQKYIFFFTPKITLNVLIELKRDIPRDIENLDN